MLFLLLHFFELASAKKMGNYGVLFNVEDYIAQSTTDAKGINRCFTAMASMIWNSTTSQSYTVLFPSRINGQPYQIWERLGPWKAIGGAWSFDGTFAWNNPSPTPSQNQITIKINIIGLTCTNAELQAAIGPTINQGGITGYANDTNTYWSPSPAIYGALATSPMNEFIEAHVAEINMHSTGNPGTASMLTYSIPDKIPVLRSHDPQSHHFFHLRGFEYGTNYCAKEYDYILNSTAQGWLYDFRLNIMGMHMLGFDMPGNSAVYNSNTPSQQHDVDFAGGLAIQCSFFNQVQIDNVILDNMYRTGIVVSNTSYSCPPPLNTPSGLAYRNSDIVVEENVIRNVWALRYKMNANGAYDDMGDGILFAGIKDGIVRRNVVFNDLTYTHQNGRIGISAMAEHNWGTLVEENVVHGYDRGMHSEDNLSGFIIRGNRITGSETGIVFDNNITYTEQILPVLGRCPSQDPCLIENNYISNEGTINPSHFEKIYPPGLIWSRQAHRSNELMNSQFKENFLVVDEDQVHYYDNTNRQASGVFTWNANVTDRLHFWSGLRGQIIQCNVMRRIPTAGVPLGINTGGMALYSYCPDEVTGVNQSCKLFLTPQSSLNACSTPLSITETVPVTIKDNAFVDTELLTFYHYASSIPPVANLGQYMELNWMNNTPNVQGTMPLSNYTVNLAPPQFNCAQEWDNTLCNGKPIVAKHDHLWDNKTLNTSMTFSNETIIVGGALTIDANLTFENCTFLMATGSEIQISNGFTLTLDHCVLQAACDELWDGIIADDPSEQMIILASTLRDMNNGVQALYGARIAAKGTTFTDNMTAMQIRHAPPGYVSGNGGNQGIVEGNTFTSTGAGPLYALPSVTQGQYGLKLIGCAEVRIGCPPAAGPSNLFSRLSTGIFIQPDAQYPTALYDLRYNRFADIRQNPNSPPDIPAILQNTYGTPAGAGIYIRRMQDPVVPVNWQNSTTPMVNILGQNGVSAFARCDKAVVGTGVSVDLWHYRINDCVGGLLVNDAHYQHFMVFGNQMDEVMLGVQLAGNLHKAQVQSNQIRLKPLNTPNYTLNGIPDPKGIEVQYWTSVHPGQTSISNNTVEIPGIRGAGITLSKNGKMSRVSDNTINFTTNITTQFNPNLASDPQLHGIVSQLGDGNYLSCNFVNGHPDVAMLGLRNSSALLLSRTLNHEVHCNQVNNTRFGAQIRGYCKTDSLLFRANTFTNHVHGLLTVPAVFSDEGDMGQIGDANQDNNNAFNGIYAQNEATYRYWGNAQNILQRKIYTAQTFSNGSNYPQDPFAPFNIQPTSSNTQNCYGISGCGSTWEPVAPPDLDPTWALEVAADSMYYYLFPELSQWVAQYQLYSNLERDSALLAANTLLNTFYQTRQNQAMGMLRGVEKMVGILSDSTSRNDSLLFMTRLNDAINQNNMVSGPEDHVQHEKWINAMLFKVFQYGRDSITLQEQEEISALAHSCPAVNGLAVYYARFLNTYYEPLSGYEDYALCNGNAKGAGGPFDALNSFLQDPKGQAEESSEPNDLLKQITVYPVPASDLVTFRSTEALGDAATLQIFDLSGRNLIATPWPKGSAEVSMHVAALPSGLYTWTCKGSGGVFAGKLIIGK
jgi:hypothetical protein